MFHFVFSKNYFLNYFKHFSVGYYPRDAQLLSLILELYIREKCPKKGVIMQVSTGEGKSVIISMLGAFWALCGRRYVDLVTSNTLLAERDATERAEFFGMLGLSVDHNNHKDPDRLKAAYQCDVVYGAMRDFLTHTVLDDFYKMVTNKLNRKSKIPKWFYLF